MLKLLAGAFVIACATVFPSAAAVVCTPTASADERSGELSLHIFNEIAVVSTDAKDTVLHCHDTNSEDRRAFCRKDENVFLIFRETSDNIILVEHYDTSRVDSGGAGSVQFGSLEMKCSPVNAASASYGADVLDREPRDLLTIPDIQ